MNSTLKGLRPASACAPNEFGLQRPSANGRLYASNEFDLEGLRPTVGLRRPKNTLRVGEGRRPARQRLGRPISIGAKPSADGRPAPTEKYSPRRRRPTPGAPAPRKADFNRRKAFGRRSACAPNEFGLQRPSADGRPAPTEKYSPRRRRPTPGAPAPRKADFNRRKAFGQRSACAPNEFDLEGPSADGRPAPTGKAFLASAKADARRASASEGRFQSAQSLRPTVGFMRRMNSTLKGLRPTVGLRRPERHSLRRRRPTPGAPAPQKADFNRRKAFGQRSALRVE